MSLVRLRLWLFLLLIAPLLAALLFGIYSLLQNRNTPAETAPSELTTQAYTERYGYRIDVLTLPTAFYERARTVYVYSPITSQAEQTHPVIYQTDGYSFIEHWLPAINQLHPMEGKTRPIIVGIDNSGARNTELIPPEYSREPRNFEHLSSSPRGEADRLLDFIKQELTPHIEQHYPHNETKMLSGFSMGGLFTLYALSDNPEFFSAYFAMSPSIWVEEGKIVERVQKTLAVAPSTKPAVYISRASEFSYGILPFDQELQQPIIHFKLASTLSNHRENLAQWRYDIHGDASHFESPARSIPIILKNFL